MRITYDKANEIMAKLHVMIMRDFEKAGIEETTFDALYAYIYEIDDTVGDDDVDLITNSNMTKKARLEVLLIMTAYFQLKDSESISTTTIRDIIGDLVRRFASVLNKKGSYER